MLLDAASDDLVDPDQIRRLLKDLREVRMAKMRSGVDVLDDAAIGGGGVALTGVGAMELGEERGFLTGVVDGLRYVIWIISFGAILLTCVAKLAHPKNKLAENNPRRGGRRLHGVLKCTGFAFGYLVWSSGAYCDADQCPSGNDIYVYRPPYTRFDVI
jgi:hypothetical protein